MSLNEIVKKVSEQTGIPKEIVDRTYRAYWKVIRKHITSLPLKEDLTDEEFMQIFFNDDVEENSTEVKV